MLYVRRGRKSKFERSDMRRKDWSRRVNMEEVERVTTSTAKKISKWRWGKNKVDDDKKY